MWVKYEVLKGLVLLPRLLVSGLLTSHYQTSYINLLKPSGFFTYHQV